MHTLNSRSSGNVALPSKNASLTRSESLPVVEFRQTRTKLPFVVESRRALDAKTMSPAMLALRANTRNMVNEAKLGLPYSANLTLMRPRPKVRWEKLPTLEKPKGYEKARRKMQEKLGQGAWVSPYEDAMQMAQPSPERWRSVLVPGQRKPVEEEEPLVVELPEVTNRKIQEIFKEFQSADSGTVPRDQFQRALQLLGFTRPEPSMCDECIQSLWSSHRIKGQHWTLPEFGVAIGVFEQRWQDSVKEKFDLNDMDRSGTVDVAELRSLCKNLEFYLLPEAVEELANEVDSDRSGQLSFEKFLEALKLLRERHGFTKDEVDHFLDVFEKFDDDNSGQIDAFELQGVLHWLGFPNDEDQCQDLINEVDLDSNGHLNKDEFLMVMRMHREKELQEVEEMFQLHDINYNGAIAGPEMRTCLLKLGYTMAEAVLNEVAKDVKWSKTKKGKRMSIIWDQPLEDQIESYKERGPNERSGEQQFIFEDFWKILKLYRQREGFLMKEISDFFDAFDHYDDNGSGEIEPFEFTKILASLGFPSTPSRRNKLWQRVDVDGSNCLVKGEFLKLMRLYYEDEAAIIRNYFESVHADVRAHTPVVFAELYKLVISMDFNPPKERLEAAIQHGCKGNPVITFDGILQMLSFLRAKRSQSFHEQAGLSDAEVTKIKRMFNRLDKDGSGDLELLELQKFLGEICPALKKSKHERERMDKIVAKADDGSGGLTLMETFWVVRNYRDELEQEKWQREQQIIEATGFTTKEVQQYRDVFIAADEDGSGYLSEQEVMDVIGGCVTLGPAGRRELRNKIDELDEDGDRQSSFTEFLQLMKVVLNVPPPGTSTESSKQLQKVTIQEEPETVTYQQPPNQEATKQETSKGETTDLAEPASTEQTTKPPEETGPVDTAEVAVADKNETAASS